MPNAPNAYTYIYARSRCSLERTDYMTDKLTEKDIEKYLRDEIKKAGGIAYKFVSPGNAGVPDRMVLLPGGRMVFVELKAPGKKPTALQNLQAKRISDLGFIVCFLDSKKEVDMLIELIERGEMDEIDTACLSEVLHKQATGK